MPAASFSIRAVPAAKNTEALCIISEFILSITPDAAEVASLLLLLIPLERDSTILFPALVMSPEAELNALATLLVSV